MPRSFAAVFALLLVVSCGSAPPALHQTAAVAVAPSHAPAAGPDSAAATPQPESTPQPEPAPTPTASVSVPETPPASQAAAPPGLSIQVPALGINLPLVEGNGLEPELYVADHYPGMKWPGQGGRSFIYAHARPGMFGPLLGAYPVGAEVDITQPGGSVLRYTITSYTNNWPVTNTSILAPADHEELVLYTCTSWNYSDPKIVAIALPK